MIDKIAGQRRSECSRDRLAQFPRGNQVRRACETRHIGWCEQRSLVRDGPQRLSRRGKRNRKGRVGVNDTGHVWSCAKNLGMDRLVSDAIAGFQPEMLPW